MWLQLYAPVKGLIYTGLQLNNVWTKFKREKKKKKAKMHTRKLGWEIFRNLWLRFVFENNFQCFSDNHHFQEHCFMHLIFASHFMNLILCISYHASYHKHLVLIKSFYPSHSLNLVLCIYFYASLLCISLYQFPSMHIFSFYASHCMPFFISFTLTTVNW